MCNSSQTEILRQVEFDTCLKLFGLHAEPEDEIFSEIRPNRDTQKHPSFYTWQLEKKLLKACVLWMNDSRIHRKMKISRDDSAVKLGCRDFHATHRKRYQSKLLLVHSKGDQCNFWGFLHRNDQRTPWWVNFSGPKHDRSRPATFMICTTFDSYVIHHLCVSMFHFWTRKYMALGMLTNLCLALLLLVAVSLVPEFHFQLTKKG